MAQLGSGNLAVLLFCGNLCPAINLFFRSILTTTMNALESSLAAFKLTSEEADGLPCRDKKVDPEIFFPIGTPDNPMYDKQMAEAKAVCARGCPIAAACLARALVFGLNDGVYGGTAPEERREMRRDPQVMAAAEATLGEAVMSKVDPRSPVQQTDAYDAAILAERAHSGKSYQEVPHPASMPEWAYDSKFRLTKPPKGKN